MDPNQQSTKMPDLNRRDGQRQTVPIEHELNNPPTYEEASSSNGASTAMPTDTATATASAVLTPPSPAHSAQSSLDGHEGAGLMGAFNRPPAKAIYYQPPQHMSTPGTTDAGVDNAGYRPAPPMTPDADDSDAKWDDLLDKPGACCSESGGCMGSSRGGCCFSDRGGCCFSDRGGCCFSDRGGCCFSDHQGCCFSDTAGCCFSTNSSACCSDGPPPRQ
jgi:hypothetical protein